MLTSLESDTPAELAGPRTLASAIHAALRADILAGRIPPGDKLPIGPLAKRFSVSLAAVREALSRLVADRLVVAEDQRGFRVSALSLADLRDVTQTRIELECLALRRSIARGDADWEARLRDAWAALRDTPHVTLEDRRRDAGAWAALHGRFHAALVAACGLDWLMRFRATLFEQSERYRVLDRSMARTERDVAGEHRRIFEATVARDAVRAEAELAAHFQRTADSLAEAFAGAMP